MMNRSVKGHSPGPTLWWVSKKAGTCLVWLICKQSGMVLSRLPIAELMGMTIAEVEAGRVVFTLVPHEYHYNPGGLVHGGVAATLCDSAMACALQTMLAQGMMYTTLELHVNYVRGMTTKTGLVRCTGEVIHQGRQMATAQSRLVDEQGRLYSHATTTCLIFAIPPDKNS